MKFLTEILAKAGITSNYFKLDTSATPPIEVGKVVWNAADGTFDMGLLNNVTLQAGQELHFYGKAVGAISNGQAVMFAGAQGDHALMTLADAATINANPEYFIGVATQDFANNQFGYVTVLGKVRGLNTSAYTAGDLLYYNSTSATDGLLTATMPSAPNAKILVAAVLRVHANEGILLVRPHTMPKISDIQDVSISSLANNNFFVYDSATSVWKNKTIAAALGYTPANDSNVVKLTGDQTVAGAKTFTSVINASTLSINGGTLVGNNIVSMRSNPTGGQFRIEKSDGSLSAYPFYIGVDGTALAYYYNASGALKVLLHTNDTSYFGNSLSVGYSTYASTSYMLDINGTARFVGALTGTSATFTNPVTIGNYDGQALKLQSATSTGSSYLRFYNSAAASRGYLGLFWNGTSDYMVFDAGALEMNFGSSNKFTFTGGGTAIFSGAITANSDVTISTGSIKMYSVQNAPGQYRYIGTEYAAGNGNNKAEIRFGIDGSDTRTKITLHTANGGGQINEVLGVFASGQFKLNNYTASTSFSGTAEGYLAFDSSGNVITVAGVAATDNTKLPLAGGTMTGTPVFTAAWGNAGGDYTGITNPAYKVDVASGYWRVVYKGAHATVSGVYNFETGKNVYWGEPADTGDYIFRGKTLKWANSAGTEYAVIHAGNISSYTAGSASSVAWSGVSAGTRTNYTLAFQPPTGDYAGFQFTGTNGAGAGYFLIRGTSDSDVYTAEGITLVADQGWLTLAQRTAVGKGIRFMTGSTTSVNRMQIDNSGLVTAFVNLQVGSQQGFDNPGGWNKNILIDATNHGRFRIKASNYTYGNIEVYLWADSSVSPSHGIYGSNSVFSFGGNIASLTVGGQTVLNAGNYSSYALPLNGNWSGNTGMNDQKLYLRTNGDNNHYLWNAADDWEELVAYNGTGFRISTSTGTALAYFSSSYINMPQAPAGATLTLGGVDNSRTYNDSNRHSLVINAPYYPHLYINATSSASNTNHGAVISMTGILSGGGYRRWGMGIANTDPTALSWGCWDNQTNPHYSVGGTLGYVDTGAKMWLNNGGALQVTGSMRAPIFYDSEDTGYYLDPNTTGTSGRFRGEIFLGPNSAGRYTRLGGNGGGTDEATVSASNGNLHIDCKGGYGLYLNYYSTNTIYVGNNGYTIAGNGSYYNGRAAVADNANSISSAVGGSYSWTGVQYFVANRNTNFDSPALQAYSNNGGGAIMSFHRGGYYAVNFGLDSDNVMRIGGWSAGANRWQLDMSGNQTVAGNVTASLDVYSNNGWFYSNNNAGWYNNTYGQGLRQSKANVSYGNVITVGENYNGWSGYNTTNTYVTCFMQNSAGTHGFYQEGGGDGWTLFYNFGYKCWGMGTDATDPSYSLHIPKYGGSNTGWIIWSDRRIKENIKTIDSALDKVLSLRGVYYNKIDDPNKERQVGYIAQEVLEIVPELVVYSEELDIYNMNYAPMVSMLTEATKEHYAKTLAQQAEIDALKEQVQTLLNHINNGV